MADGKTVKPDDVEEEDIGKEGAGAPAAPEPEEEEGAAEPSPAADAKPALPPLPTRRPPGRARVAQRDVNLSEEILKKDTLLSEKDAELAKEREKIADLERRLKQKGSRKAGHTSSSNLGRHELDIARIRKNREARGEDPDAPMYVTVAEQQAAYKRFAKNNRLTPTMQPQAGQDKVQMTPRTGRRIDRTE